MTSTRPAERPSDGLRERARALANAGTWGDVCALLANRTQAARAQPELVTLLAEAYLRTGNARDAQHWLADSLEPLDRSGDRAEMRRAVNLLGASQFELGALDAAQRAFQRAAELARVDHDHLLVARATNNLGAIANIRGQRESALALYQLAIPAYQRLGSALGLAQCYHNMAITFRDTGHLDAADEYERRAMEFAREASSPSLLALAQLGRAEVTLRRGDAALAEAAARRAAEIFAGIPDPVSQADALRLAGVASVAQGELDRAATVLDQALSLAQAHGAALNEAETLRATSELAAARGDLESALHQAIAALAIFAELDAAAERDAVRAWLEQLDLRARARGDGNGGPPAEQG